MKLLVIKSGGYAAYSIRRRKNRPIVVRALTPNSTLNPSKLSLHHIKNYLKNCTEYKIAYCNSTQPSFIYFYYVVVAMFLEVLDAKNRRLCSPTNRWAKVNHCYGSSLRL